MKEAAATTLVINPDMIGADSRIKAQIAIFSMTRGMREITPQRPAF